MFHTLHTQSWFLGGGSTFDIITCSISLSDEVTGVFFIIMMSTRERHTHIQRYIEFVKIHIQVPAWFLFGEDTFIFY